MAYVGGIFLLGLAVARLLILAALYLCITVILGRVILRWHGRLFILGLLLLCRLFLGHLNRHSGICEVQYLAIEFDLIDKEIRIP